MVQRLLFQMYYGDFVPQYQANGEAYEVEIDVNTVIATEFQSYDLHKPAERLRNHTNNFSIPATNKNLAFFNFPNNKSYKPEGSLVRSIYNTILATYQIDNVFIFYRSSIRIESISGGRINITIVDNNQVLRGVNLLKSIFWDKDASNDDTGSLMAIYARYINATFGLQIPLDDTPFTGTWVQFYDAYIKDNIYLKAAPLISNMGNITQGDASVEYDVVMPFYKDDNSSEDNNGYGARFCVKTPYLFSAINWYYANYSSSEITFDTSFFLGNPLSGNAGSFDNSHLFAPSFIVVKDGGNWYFSFRSLLTSAPYYAGMQDQKDKPSKTAYDLLITCCQKFNWFLKETIDVENKSVIKLYQLNKINEFDNTNIVDWSANIKEITKFSPATKGLFKDSYISPKSFYDGGNFRAGATAYLTNNYNLDVEGVWLNVDMHMPAKQTTVISSTAILRDSKCFEQFVFFNGNDSAKTSYTVALYHGASYTVENLWNLEAVGVESLDWGGLTWLFEYPRVFEIKKYITLDEISKLNFFNQYYIDQLGASFYINKITGYNPYKSFEAATIELIQVSNKIPFNPIIPNAWVDGLNQIFGDGTGDYFIY